jgi:RecB family exonuclease
MPLPDLPVPEPTPILKVSPSLANDLLACQLRVAFSRDTSLRSWQRPSTYTSLGEVAHAVTEAALRGNDWGANPSTVRSKLEAFWDEMVSRSSAALAKAWTPSVPPLPELWPGYQLTRVRTIRRAVRTLASSGAATQPHYEGTGAEVELEDSGSGLFGRVDRIERHGLSTRVIDLKTGLRQHEPTEEQRRQLLLYAILVHRTSGEWPSEIVIEDASGGQMAMPLDIPAAETAASEVDAAVRMFNDHISHRDVVSTALATPERCRWCAFRVVCTPYWRELRSDWRQSSVLGEIVEADPYEQGAFVELRIESPVDLASQVVHVSALPASPAPENRWMAAVGVEGDPSEGEVRARWSTTTRTW